MGKVNDCLDLKFVGRTTFGMEGENAVAPRIQEQDQSTHQNESRHTLASFHVWEENHIRLLDKLSEEIEERRRRLNESISRDHERQVRQLLGDLERLAKECEDIVAHFKREQDIIRQEIQDMTPKLQRSLDKHHTLIAELKERHSKKIASRMEEVAKLQSLSQELLEANAVAQAKIDMLASGSLLAHGKKAEDSLKSALDDIRQKIEDQKHQMEGESREMANEMSEKSRILQDEYRHETEEKDDLQRQLEDLSSVHDQKLSDLQNELRDMSRRMKTRRIDSDKDDLEREIDQLQAQIVSSYNKESQNFETFKQESMRTVNRTQNDLINQRKDMNKKREEGRRKLSDINNKILEIHKEEAKAAAAFKNKMARLQKDLKSIEQNQESYRVRGEKEDNVRKASLRKNRFDEKEKQLLNRLKSLQDRITDSTKRHKDLKASMEDLITQSHRRLDEGMNYLSDRDERDLQKIADLQGQIRDALLRCKMSGELAETLKNDHFVQTTLESEQHLTDISCYQNQFAEKEDEIRTLKQQTENAQDGGYYPQANEDEKAIYSALKQETDLMQSLIIDLSKKIESMETEVKSFHIKYRSETTHIQDSSSEFARQAEDEKKRVFEQFEKDKESFNKNTKELNARIRKALDQKSIITAEFEEKLEKLQAHAYQKGQENLDEFVRKKKDLQDQVQTLTRNINDLEYKKRTATEEHTRQVKLETEKHEETMGPLRGERMKNLGQQFAHGDVQPIASLPIKDQQAQDTGHSEELRKELRNVKKANKKLEKLHSILETKEYTLKKYQKRMQRKADSGQGFLDNILSQEEYDIAKSMSKSKEEKDSEISDLQKQADSLKREIVSLRRKKDTLLSRL